MRIGITGTMSVGKTTLIKALKKNEQFKGYHSVTERSKYLRDLGIPLNTDSTVQGQFIFMAERASELLRENLLTDRTIWDVCAFTLSSKSITWRDKQKIVESATTLMPFYDIVFYVSPEGLDIEDNGVRETNVEYRTAIDFAIQNLLKEYPPKKLVEIKGTTKERIAMILEHLKT